MPKPSEKCRGEYRTLEAIRERAQILSNSHDPKTAKPNENYFWDLACEEIYVEFINEGLMQTANEVLKNTSEDFKIVC